MIRMLVEVFGAELDPEDKVRLTGITRVAGLVTVVWGNVHWKRGEKQFFFFLIIRITGRAASSLAQYFCAVQSSFRFRLVLVMCVLWVFFS